MSINLTSGAIIVLPVGLLLDSKSSKERQEDSEWSSGLQWSYPLCTVDVFGILFEFMSFTVVLLVFAVFTGIAQAIHKGRLKKSGTGEDNAHFTDYMGDFFLIILVIFMLHSPIAELFQVLPNSICPGLVKGDFILMNKFSYGIRLPILDKVATPVDDTARDNVVVFNHPLQPETDCTERIVGIPGGVVEYRDRVLTANGEITSERPDGNYQYADDINPSTIHTFERFQTALSSKNSDVVKEAGQPSVSIAVLNKHTSEVIPESNYSFEESGLENYEHVEGGNDLICKVPEGRYFVMGDNRGNNVDSHYWGSIDDKLTVDKTSFVQMDLGEFSRIGISIQ